jgi:peptidoglycan/xylan/chitin deacetylase (PgdA/CDA1 family)
MGAGSGGTGRPRTGGWLAALWVWGAASGACALAPGPSPSAAPVSAAREQSFTVLCYHRFLSPQEEKAGVFSEYRLPVEQFEWQMQYLKDHGITPISIGQLEDYWFKGAPLPDKAVLLTFDDGFRSIYQQAYPVMKRFGYPGILFLYTDFIKWGESADYNKLRRPKDEELCLKVSEIKEMEANGFTVESHTKSHLNMAMVGERMSLEEYRDMLKTELNEPLDFIRETFGKRATVLAYPYGVYDPEVLRQTRESGYELAFTVNPGPNDRTLPPLRLHRNLVLNPTAPGAFAAIFKDKVLHLDSLSPGDGEVILDPKPDIRIGIGDEINPKTLVLSMGPYRLPFHYDAQTRVLTHRLRTALKGGGHIMSLEARGMDGTPRSFTWYFRVLHHKERKKGGPD